MEDAGHDITLDSRALNELNGPDARALLDTIDSLRDHQVGEIVNLPQIIVVGDQSSGKSSVLEAISCVRFPTKGDVCTRFATELVLRQAEETRISVTIDSARSETAQPFRRTSFNKDDLPNIISEAAERMGICAGSGRDFSRDILRVEISSPDVYPLTLVDLPGFFHSGTADQSPEGRDIVLQLAEHYMKQPKSIILAVVAANNNLANQLVVEEAKRHDPKRERTLGVITKPDLAVAKSHDEKKCLNLVRGQEASQQLKLGWHVLCNRPEGREAASVEERDAEEEKFFSTGAWSNLPPSSRGITTLRKKLSKVLLGHIQKTLPGLIEEIESSLSTRQRALEQLGNPRSETSELRTYMYEISEKFTRLARNGVNGHYSDEFFGDLYDEDHETRKLRALLRRLNRAFHATLVLKGVDREIDWDDEERVPFPNGGFDWIRNGEDAPEYLEQFLHLFDEFEEPTTISETELCKELRKLAVANQGTEFPDMPNAELGFQLFKMQAKPWGGIADFYLDLVINFAKSYVEDLFIHIIGAAKQTTNAVLVTYVETFFDDKRKVLKDKLQEILRPYVAGYGPALDAEFHATISSRTAARDAGRLASLLEETFPAAFTEKGGKGLTHETVEQLILDDGKRRASEFGIERVIDMAMTHYEMSLSTFTENVVNLAVESCLICDLHTILTPSMVIHMDDGHLQELASESEDVQAERRKLQHEVKNLRKGLKKCQKYRVHEKTVLPGTFLSSPTLVPDLQSPSSSNRDTQTLSPSPQPPASQPVVYNSSLAPPSGGLFRTAPSSTTTSSSTSPAQTTTFSFPKAGPAVTTSSSSTAPTGGNLFGHKSSTSSNGPTGTASSSTPGGGGGGLFASTSNKGATTGGGLFPNTTTPSGGSLFGSRPLASSNGVSNGTSSSSTPSVNLFGPTASNGASNGKAWYGGFGSGKPTTSP